MIYVVQVHHLIERSDMIGFQIWSFLKNRGIFKVVPDAPRCTTLIEIIKKQKVAEIT